MPSKEASTNFPINIRGRGRMSLVDARALMTAKHALLNPISRAVDDVVSPAERARRHERDERTLGR